MTSFLNKDHQINLLNIFDKAESTKNLVTTWGYLHHSPTCSTSNTLKIKTIKLVFTLFNH